MNETEALCENCGRKNIAWFRPSDLWNKYGRTESNEPMLCPNCFAERAEAQGFVPTAWILTPEKQP